MAKKKYIGQLISLKFKDRKSPIYGYVLDYNDDWTLMKSNPVDYVIDGYLILRHKNIEGFRRDVDEKWREKIINLKGLQPTEKEIIPLDNLPTILEYLTKNYGVFSIYTKSESACYLGALKSINNKEFVMGSLSLKGKWNGELKLRNNDVRVIEFDNDYINSLKLVARTKKSK